MSGELAQCMAVATHVTMWLADSRDGRGRSDGQLSIPLFADLVAFDSVAGVQPWADRLAEDKVDRLWLAVASLGMGDRFAAPITPMSAAFVGGVPFGLMSTGPAGNQLWQLQWSAARRAADGAEIMVANYLSGPAPVAPARVAIQNATGELDRTLRRAAQFADRQQLPTWAQVFTEAPRQREGGGSSQGGDHRGLFPSSWPDPDGAGLAETAMAAWVFGGMGSWNDLGFTDSNAQQEYEEISRDLLEALLLACVAAVNIDLP